MRAVRRLAALLVGLVLVGTSQATAQQGGVAAAEPRFHLVRSIAGPRGVERDGRFVVEDARSTFYVPADKQVVIYFEWDGPIGPHHVEGFWKGPGGKTVIFSEFTYEAKQKRFGAYWQLDLADTIAAGMWTLEAHVDGELAGVHTFQIVAAPKPADTKPARPLLTPAEVYQRILKASVFIDSLNAQGELVRRGSGFFVQDGLVLTAFQVIDGAAKLRLLLPDGRSSETAEVAAYNRLQDWAVLKAALAAPGKLTAAVAKSWAVGDRCFSLNVPAPGSRVIVDDNVIGTNAFPQVGERLNLAAPTAADADGAPVVNEYGELIGVLGGLLYPGAGGGIEGYIVAAHQGGLATPINLVQRPSPDSPVKSLAELDASGQFVPRLKKQPELLYGALDSSFPLRSGELLTTRESKTEFSRKDGRFAVALMWNPRVKVRGEIALTIYDLNNQALIRTKPSRMKLNAGEYIRSLWSLNIAQLPVGGYRCDVFEDGAPIWRAYFRVIE